MKPLISVLASVFVLILAGRPEAGATTQYVDIDTVVVIYSRFYYTEDIRLDLSAADVQGLKDGTEEAVEWIWVHSNLKCHINVLEYLEPDRALYLDQIVRSGSGKYMFYHWSIDGETSLETDLFDAGYVDGDATIVVSLWAFNRDAGPIKWGGETYPATKENPTHPHLLGDSAHCTIPVKSIVNAYTRTGVIEHEVMHALDSKLKQSGYPDAMISPDRPGDWPGIMDNSGVFSHGNMNSVLPAEWLAIYSYLATTQTVLDTDEDGVPDDADVPLDELSFGSDKRKPDKDGDGLTDLEEANVAYWGSSLPRTADTDGDGIEDGSDAEPLIDATTDIAKSTGITVDGIVGGGEYTFITNYNGTDSDHSVDVYAAWTDGSLYFAADVRDNDLNPGSTWADAFKICIDANNDGWWIGDGDENYEIWVCPEDVQGEAVLLVWNYNSSNQRQTLMTTDTIAASTSSGTDWTIEVEIADAELLGVTFSESTQLRIGFLLNDSDEVRDGFDIFTGAENLGQGFPSGNEAYLYCLDFTLVN